MPQKYVTQTKQPSNYAVANNALANGISMSAVHPLQKMEGNNTPIALDQERHLPQEAWHVMQQKKGIVRPATQMEPPGYQPEKTVQKKEDAGNAAKEKRSFSPEEIEAAIRQALSNVKLDPAELTRMIKVIEQMEKVSLDISQIDQKLPVGSDQSGNDAPVQKVDALPPGPIPAGGFLGIMNNVALGLGLSIRAAGVICAVYQILYGGENGVFIGIFILSALAHTLR